MRVEMTGTRGQNTGAMQRPLLLILGVVLATGTSACRNNDYFKDGYDERQERLEDRRDRRAMDKAERDDGLNMFERTEEWWEKSQRRMDRDEWGDF